MKGRPPFHTDHVMHDALCPKAHRSWIPRPCQCALIEKARGNVEALVAVTRALDQLTRRAQRTTTRNPMEHDHLCPRDKDTTISPNLCTFCQVIDQVRAEYE